jgi:hypothetical protein
MSSAISIPSGPVTLIAERCARVSDLRQYAFAQLKPSERNLRIARDLSQQAGLGPELVVVGEEALCLRSVFEGV